MLTEEAETVALRALAFVAADERRLRGLLLRSGIDFETLRARADDPAVLAGVLDHLLSDEAAVLAFCEQEGLEPTTPARARALLPGGPSSRHLP